MIHTRTVYRGLGAFQEGRKARTRRAASLRDAFNAGQRARAAGKSFNACHYADPRKVEAWRKGWEG